jgi:hypothetical protein
MRVYSYVIPAFTPGVVCYIDAARMDCPYQSDGYHVSVYPYPPLTFAW